MKHIFLSRSNHSRYLNIIVISIISILAIIRVLFLFQNTHFAVGHDARSYVAAAKVARLQLPLYDYDALLDVAKPVKPGPYLYPPLLAIAFIPLSELPVIPASLICVLMSAICAVILAIVLHKIVGWLPSLFFILVFPPTWHTIYLGQINLFISILLGLFFIAIQQNKLKTAAIYLSIATLFKVTPALVICCFIRKRLYNSILVFLLVAISSVVATSLFVTPTTWIDGFLIALRQSWTSPEMISWSGLLSHHFGAPGERLGLVLSILLLGMTVLRVKHVPLSLAAAAVMFLSLMIARITWEHHATMILPALAVLWQARGFLRVIAGVTWLGIGLIGGLALPILVTVCWLVCCWPEQQAKAMKTAWSLLRSRFPTRTP